MIARIDGVLEKVIEYFSPHKLQIFFHVYGRNRRCKNSSRPETICPRR